jgi:DNA-directed RNA polymerase specialized sigma subunit
MMRHLLSCGLSKTKIRRLYSFINMYVSFQNLENKLKFEREVRKITKSREPMGIEEAILKEVREQSLEQGIEQNQRTVTIRSYKKGMSVTDIADITELTVEEVEQIIATYKAEQQG